MTIRESELLIAQRLRRAALMLEREEPPERQVTRAFAQMALDALYQELSELVSQIEDPT